MHNCPTKKWRAQRDSNPQSPPSEGGALSSSAMGTHMWDYICASYKNQGNKVTIKFIL